MRKFFVGQRVKLVISADPENIGVEGQVSHTGIWEYGDTLPSGNWYSDKEQCQLYVEWDRTVNVGTSKRKSSAIQSYRVEPILPEGAAPSEFTFQQLMDELKRIEA